MGDGSFYKANRKMIALLFSFSCALTFLTHNFDIVYALTETIVYSGNLSNDNMLLMSGVFAPLVGIGGSPFIALTILSGAGSLLNSGIINAENIPLSNAFMALPIANIYSFIPLFILACSKFLLSMLGISKVFCDIALGKLEDLTGKICIVVGTFLVAYITTTYASSVASTTVGGLGIWTFVLTNIISFTISMIAYTIYVVLRTMVSAIDSFVLLLSPIPGATGIFTILKHLVVIAYTIIAITNPIISSLIGVLCVDIACFVFRLARRLELYYKRIYLMPFLNAIFRSKKHTSLIPDKLPYGILAEFDNVDFCVECFIMDKIPELHKREQCYFIGAKGSSYIYKKRHFGKSVKIKLPTRVYIEKSFVFNFLRIFTTGEPNSNQRIFNLVISREHEKNIIGLTEKAKLRNFNESKQC